MKKKKIFIVIPKFKIGGAEKVMIHIANELTKYDLKIFDSFSKVKKKYDVVILISVLEHVKNPISFLKKISSFLKKNGKIIIEVPNVNDPLVSLYNLDYYKEKYYRKVHLNYRVL